jgi:hypothetical protein
LEGGMEGLQKWRVGGGIWRGLKNGGPFGGPAGVVFFHQTSKIWSRGQYGGPHWSCSNQSLAVFLALNHQFHKLSLSDLWHIPWIKIAGHSVWEGLALG